MDYKDIKEMTGKREALRLYLSELHDNELYKTADELAQRPAETYEKATALAKRLTLFVEAQRECLSHGVKGIDLTPIWQIFDEPTTHWLAAHQHERSDLLFNADGKPKPLEEIEVITAEMKEKDKCIMFHEFAIEWPRTSFPPFGHLLPATCKLIVPCGKRQAYIDAGWTESIFKGGVVEEEGTGFLAMSTATAR